MPARLDGKVAMVTGAGSGIGQAAALALAAEGARLILADLGSAEHTRRQIVDAGGAALAVKCDVTQEDDVRTLVAQALGEYGRLDCAFNNAGIEGTAERAVHETEEVDWQRVIATNLTGVWLSMKHQVPAMLNDGGSIVNGASVAGLVGFDRNAAYVASKHAVLGLTKTAALEYAAQGIRVNAVCPGVVRTAFTDRFTGGTAEGEAPYTAAIPLGRLAEPAEVARSVVWLCSAESSYVTGHGLVIDGGLVSR
jgi:NAD(P)-dependent dehydrogenase (short-subunit alcohol dehydrogenase family)